VSSDPGSFAEAVVSLELDGWGADGAGEVACWPCGGGDAA